jgi:thiamine-monophosphate kinase
MVEGVHFRREGRTPHDIGWKAVAVNLSDIASMGGAPVAFLLTLVIPASDGRKFILDLVRGAAACGRRHGAQLMGGNVSSTRGGELVVDVSMVGSVSRRLMLLRSGARPGDTIFVAGWPGRSRAGLAILESEDKGLARKFPGLVKAHLRPEPMLRAGANISGRGIASSMIDMSDGLVQDLGHICESSGVGAEIDPATVPIHKDLKRFCLETGIEALEMALSGGEDYGLVFTVKERNAAKAAALVKSLGLKITPIGLIVSGKGVNIPGVSGVEVKGFDHLTPRSPAPRRP